MGNLFIYFCVLGNNTSANFFVLADKNSLPIRLSWVAPIWPFKVALLFLFIIGGRFQGRVKIGPIFHLKGLINHSMLFQDKLLLI